MISHRQIVKNGMSVSYGGKRTAYWWVRYNSFAIEQEWKFVYLNTFIGEYCYELHT